jgi:AcrR family transcriptional regulator
MAPKKATGPRERRNRTDEVIAAAIDVFHRKGFAAASVQDVADQVGVLKGSLYYYIDSKEDLLFRVFDESHQQALEIVEETLAMDGPPLVRLRSYFYRYVLWYLQNLERVSVYFNEWRSLTGERRDTVVRQRRVYAQLVTDLIEEAKSEGAVAADVDTKYATFFILTAVNGIPIWYRRTGPDPPERIAAAYADMVIGTLVGTGSDARARTDESNARRKRAVPG